MDAHKTKILIVDDEPDIVETLKDYLGRRGYAVIGALSGEEALNILEKEKADLILMDIMMPGIKGTDASRLIKQKYPSVKVLILTAYPQETEALVKENILEGVFAKPLSMQELYDKLSHIIHPADEKSVDTNIKQGIKARVLLIKARILLLESSPEAWNILNSHFSSLSKRGEYYDLKAVNAPGEVDATIKSFNPDMIMANTLFINNVQDEVERKYIDDFLLHGKMIVYTLGDAKSIKDTEVERLIRTVEAYSFKNGLIEVKWIDI